MARTIEGHLDAKGVKAALVVARWNEAVTTRLLDGAMEAFLRNGAAASDLTVIRVPGSWEVPLVAAKLAASSAYDTVVGLGCLIRGETSHYDLLATEAASGLARAAADSGKPVLFGILTCESLEQALDRAGGKAGNKGWDAAVAAIELVSLYKRLA